MVHQACVINFIVRDSYYIAITPHVGKIIICAPYFARLYPRLTKGYFITYHEPRVSYHTSSTIIYPDEIDIICFFPCWTNRYHAIIDLIFLLCDINSERGIENERLWNVIYALSQSNNVNDQKQYIFDILITIISIIYGDVSDKIACEHDEVLGLSCISNYNCIIDDLETIVLKNLLQKNKKDIIIALCKQIKIYALL
jgi:hypothetical protein